MIYIFGPIMILMVACSACVGGAPKGMRAASLASIPSAASASIRNWGASASDGPTSLTLSGRCKILTRMTEAPIQTLGPHSLMNVWVVSQSISVHPACFRASEIHLPSCMCSGWFVCRPKSNCEPANRLNFSATRPVCSGSSFLHSKSSDNLSCASAAVRYASATFWSERRFNFDWAVEYFLPKVISPYIATANRRSHAMNSAVSRSGLLPEYSHKTTASKNNAKTTARVQKSTLREFTSTSRSSSVSLLCSAFVCIGFVRLSHRIGHYTPSRRERIIWRIVWLIFWLLVFVIVATRP